MKQGNQSANILTLIAGIVILGAGIMMNDNKGIFMLTGVMFMILGAGMYTAERLKAYKH